MKIDKAKIREQLDRLVNPPDEPRSKEQQAAVTVHLDKTSSKVGLKVSDSKRPPYLVFDVSFNPAKIHTDKQLDEAMNWVGQQLVSY